VRFGRIGIAILLAAVNAEGAPKTGPPEPALLPDNGGAIRHLLVHFADYDVIPTLYGLFMHAPPAMRITVVTPPGKRRTLTEQLLRGWKVPHPGQIDLVDGNEDLFAPPPALRPSAISNPGRVSKSAPHWSISTAATWWPRATRCSSVTTWSATTATAS
jgi:hypothetical protein